MSQPRALRRATFVAASCTAGIGAAALLAWALGLFSRIAIAPPYVSIKPNTAMCFVLAGASLWLHASGGGRRAARAGGAAVAVVGLLTVAEWARGIDLGIDQLLFRDLPGSGDRPGRMAPVTAVNFFVLGAALVAADAGRRRLTELSQLLAVAVTLVGLLGLTGYLYSVPMLHTSQNYTMALPASLAFIVAGLGVLALRPDRGLVAIIASDSAGGASARRLLPWVVLAPLVIGWLTLEGQRAGLYDVHLGVAWMVFGSVVVFSIVVWANAYPLHRLEERYRALMEQANDAILILRLDHRILEANRAAEQLLGRPRTEIVGRHYDDFVVPEERADAAQRQEEFLRRGALRIGRRRLMRADGGTVSVEVSGSVARLDGEATAVVILHDNAERDEAEAALRRSESRMKSVLDAALDAVIMMDARGLVTSWNERAVELFGWTREEALGRSLAELIIPPRYREAHARGLSRFLATGEGPVIGRRVELPALRRDRSEFPVELTVTALEEGGAHYFNAFVADITERKRAEEALRAAERRLHHVISSSPAVLYSLGVEDGVLLPGWVGENIQRLMGYTPAEVSGPEWWAARLHPEDRERVMAQVPTLLAEGHITREYRFRHKDGGFRWVRDEQVLIEDEAGRREVVGSWSDITARKEAELRLRENEEQYRLLFENNPHPMWVYDEETLRFRAVNDAALSHYEYSREEFLGMSLSDIRPAEEVSALDEHLERRRRERDVKAFNAPRVWKHRKKDGTVIDVEISGSPIVFEGRRAWLVLVTDVTEKRSLEAQLLQSQKIESMGRLAGGVAHDFNNLLGVISGYGDLLRKRVASDPRLARYVSDIMKAAERAAGLTRQLLAFSRKQVLQPRILDLNAVVGETEKMLRRLIGEDIQLVTVLDEHLGSVRADPGQMDQVLMNLAVNARDAMPRGGRLTIETSNVVLDRRHARRHPGVEPGSYVMLAVSDTGHGMTPEVLARVFEPFFTTKEQGKGTGLGLATVHGIVRQSGGHVWVYSEPGQGAAFKIYLPRADAPAGEAEAAAAEELPRGSETILLVEDEASLRELVRECLEGGGYTVLEARNGTQALELGERHSGSLHLLVTDVVMPGMSGRELAERLRAARPEIRILYMSGYTDDAVVLHGVLAENMAFLQKPFTAQALAQTVREVLDRTMNE